MHVAGTFEQCSRRTPLLATALYVTLLAVGTDLVHIKESTNKWKEEHLKEEGGKSLISQNTSPPLP